MTQSNPLSTEEQVHVKDAKLTANRVFRVAAIIFGGHIAAIIFLLYQALQIGSWQIYTMTAVLTVAGAIFFAALRMMRKGHLETGGWLLIAATLVGIITGPL